MKAHFTYEVRMDMRRAEFICANLGIEPPYRNKHFIVNHVDEDTEPFASVIFPQDGLDFSRFLYIAAIGMQNSSHPWTQVTTRCHMDDKGCSLWDTIGEHGYHHSEGYYNATSLGIHSHEKLERIKEIINE